MPLRPWWEFLTPDSHLAVWLRRTSSWRLLIDQSCHHGRFALTMPGLVLRKNGHSGFKRFSGRESAQILHLVRFCFFFCPETTPNPKQPQTLNNPNHET